MNRYNEMKKYNLKIIHTYVMKIACLSIYSKYNRFSKRLYTSVPGIFGPHFIFFSIKVFLGIRLSYITTVYSYNATSGI